ncbi:MAG TPA: transcriptional regulator [Bryobacteraceae bacterium]|nr:transcriptional regulator [Bryobacteraceae bacterium]
MGSQGTRVERPAKYQFADFELLPNQGALWKAGVRVAVMPKPFATLLVLVDRAGETVSKDELLAEVWNGASVEENNLTQSISALRKTLGEKRGENRFIATEPGNGYRFVAPVTRVEDQPGGTSESALEFPARAPRRKHWTLVAGMAVLVILLAGALFWTRSSAVRTMRRKSVAVLHIRDLSKSPTEAWLQVALAEMLTSELAASGKLHAVPAEDVARWRIGRKTNPETEPRADVLRQAHVSFGADTFILGSYLVVGACPDCTVRIDLGLFDANSGDQVATVIEEGREQDLLDVTTRLGAKLRADLGAGGASAAIQRWPAASAMKEYAEGLKSLRRIDPMAARDHLQAAVAADPANALVHSALADAWSMLGYGSRAIEENKRANDLATSLGRLDQLGIEARYRASAQQWDQAIEIYQTIFRLFPDSLEDGLNLAKAQFRARKIADSIATLENLRKLPSPQGNDPRIDLIAAQDAGTTNDFAKTRDLARRAATEAKAREARYLYARARLLEGGAMQTLVEPGFEAVQNEARSVCQELWDRQCVSQAWRVRGNELYYSGKFAEAQQAYGNGLGVARELGDLAEQANLLTGLAVVAESNQDWSNSEKNLKEAISLKKESGYDPCGEQIQLADFYFRTGRLSDAEGEINEAERETRKTGAHEYIGELLNLRASLARSAGRLDLAQELNEKALAELTISQAGQPITLVHAALSSILTARGDLQSAERQLRDVSESASPEVSATVELARAELFLAKQQYRQAAEAAQRSAAHFGQAHQMEESAIALVMEAGALELMGHNSDALKLCQEAERSAAHFPNLVPLLRSRLAVWSLSGDPDSQVPADLHAEIASLGNPELSLEEDYYRAARAKRTGGGDAKELSEALAKRARSLGFFTLARRAVSMNPSPTAPTR